MDTQAGSTLEDKHFPRPVLYGWIALRLVTHIWLIFISPLRPLTARERALALWPPRRPWGAWLERLLLAPLERWDVQYYIWIASRGYRLDDGTAQFHPLFAWLAKPLVLLGFSPLFSLLLVSSGATLLLLYVLYHLARLDFAPRSARIATLLCLCSPFAFAFFIPYPEALFLLWAVLCLYWARRRRWYLAGMAGGLATLTRQQGIFLALPLLWELWEAHDRDWRRLLGAFQAWLALALVPLGYGVWLAFRAVVLQDFHPDFSSLHSLTYSLLISPSAARVVPVQTFMWPWRALALAFAHLVRAPDVDIVTNLLAGLYFVLLLALAWKYMRPSYRVYALVTTLVSFGYHTGPFHPYMGLPRHLLLAFPVFIGISQPARRPWVRRLLLSVGLVGMFFLLLLYGLEAWVP